MGGAEFGGRFAAAKGRFAAILGQWVVMGTRGPLHGLYKSVLGLNTGLDAGIGKLICARLRRAHTPKWGLGRFAATGAASRPTAHLSGHWHLRQNCVFFCVWRSHKHRSK